MLFSSTVFLFVFLPLVIFLYVSVRKNLKQYVLLFASLFFYAWGEPRYLAVMLFVCVVNYLTALGVDRAKSKGKIALLFPVLSAIIEQTFENKRGAGE